MILREKNFPVCLNPLSDGSFEFFPVSPEHDVTHIFCVKYYFVGRCVYYYVSSVVNVSLGVHFPFKPVTLSTSEPYDSCSVDMGLYYLCHSYYKPYMHNVMRYIHLEMIKLKK